METKVRITKMLMVIGVLILVVPPWFLATASLFWQMASLVTGFLILSYSVFSRMNSKVEKEYWNAGRNKTDQIDL